MNETLSTLISVVFGSLLGFLFQQLSSKQNKKESLRKEKITIYQRLLKVDKISGPDNENIHGYHFDNHAFLSKVYPKFLDDYLYYPKGIRSTFDSVYYYIKVAEIDGIPEEVTSKDFYRNLSKIYREGIQKLENELLLLIEQ